MKWLLIVMVFGQSPHDTGLVFDTHAKCVAAEAVMRSQIAASMGQWTDATGKDLRGDEFSKQLGFVMRAYGAENQATCVPHR